ncbi:MAG TPA: hypothetical protein VG755_35595 [Nannocystaceae bacterium]|nr:hypothetical protein [Nannocystaceae bacterium]
MALHRRQLPIVSPCDGFEGREATDREPAFCTRCAKPVHDLSRLTEREVVTLLARHVGGGLCLSYRTRDDGAIVTRAAPPSRLAPAVIAASLAGCAGHLGDAEARARDCLDADGYRVDCPPQPRLDQPVIPDAIADDRDDDEVPAAPTEIAGVEPGELIEVQGTMSRGLVVVEAVAAPPPPPAVGVVATAPSQRLGPVRGGISLGGTGPYTEKDLSPRVRRELRRIERRERRRARRERDR